MYALFWLSDIFNKRVFKYSKTEPLNKLNQQGKLVKYPTTLLHLRKTDKTTYQSTLMLWEGNRQIQEYTDDFVFTTVYDDQSFEPVARVVQTRNLSDDGHLNNTDNTETFKVYHYYNNHLGTPQELTNELGEVVWCNYEFAWGGRYQSYYKEQSLNGCAIIESDLQPTHFQGQSLDVETGLYYNRFRYYDSNVGMFISRDPIGLLGGNNVFAYAPNPVGWVDPWGLARNPCTKTSKKLPKKLRNKLKRIKNQSNSSKKDTGISGSVSQKEAIMLGEAFVGKNHRTMSNNKGLVSKDGLKTFRFPAPKKGRNPKTLELWSNTGKQVNFETKNLDGVVISNVHLDVK